MSDLCRRCTHPITAHDRRGHRAGCDLCECRHFAADLRPPMAVLALLAVLVVGALFLLSLIPGVTS